MNPWDTIWVKAYCSQYTYNISIDVASWSLWVNMREWYTPWKVLTVESIGSKWIVYLFWKVWEEFYVWDDTVNSVISGSITLPNAVWFIQVWKYKIPYYR